jgi:hypothetical protein
MAITVGCDPEFLVKNPDGSFTDFNVNITDDHGVIGADHGYRVGELRPKHGTPAQVTEHIRAQMQTIALKKPGIKIIAGGGRPSDGTSYARESIGGHIHFGGIRLNMNYDSCTRTHFGSRQRWGNSRIQPTCPDNKLVLALDYYIGRRLQKVPGGKRPNGSHYGRCSDIETKGHDGGGFEYRTPPSWLTDPYLTESTLAIGKRIAEMWMSKPQVFDHLFFEAQNDNAIAANVPQKMKSKSVARRKDYDFLIPTTGADRRYMTQQIKRFKRATFSKTYKMDNPECINLWLNPTKLNAIYEPHLVQNTPTSTEVETVRRISTAITLQMCQVKMIDRQETFESETVLGVAQFAIPEVRVYPFAEYTPWQFQLTHDVRLRPDTIYFSKELRPFLKLKRGGNFQNRFIEIKQRRAVDGARQISSLTNCIFYNAARSNPDIKARILEIFVTCARKKLRRNDAE